MLENMVITDEYLEKAYKERVTEESENFGNKTLDELREIINSIQLAGGLSDEALETNLQVIAIRALISKKESSST